jgi:hypothetical protein
MEADQMIIVNESVEHVIFGSGVITEVNDNKIWVKFQDAIGIKVFLYPDEFEKFLKALNPSVEDNVLEEWHRKQEQIELDLERKEKECEAAELEEKKAKLQRVKRKSSMKTTKKI